MSGIAARSSSNRPHDWLIKQLPVGMLDDDFFVRFVSLFQAEANSLIEHADGLQHLADVRLAPSRMVQYMAEWIGAPGIDAGMPDLQQRTLVLATAEALRNRGTMSGLRTMLEVWTGASVEIRESGGIFQRGEATLEKPWVRIAIPTTGSMSTHSLITLIRDEIPAHLCVELWVDAEKVWATPGWAGVPQTQGEQA